MARADRSGFALFGVRVCVTWSSRCRCRRDVAEDGDSGERTVERAAAVVVNPAASEGGVAVDDAVAGHGEGVAVEDAATRVGVVAADDRAVAQQQRRRSSGYLVVLD